MSSVFRRVVQIQLFFVGTPIVYMITDVMIQWRFRIPSTRSTHLTNFITGALFIIVWTLMWRSGVTWSSRRILLTVLSVPVTALLAAWVGYELSAFWMSSANIILAWSLWAVLWLASTTFIWHMPTSRRIGSIPCPECDYDLRGQKQTRCPECGTDFSLDDIVLQAVRDVDRAVYFGD